MERCVYCDTPLDRRAGSPNSAEIDHRKAYANGGETVDENLDAACRSCNRSKGAKELGENDDQNRMATTEQEATEVSSNHREVADNKEPAGPLVQQIRSSLSRLRLEHGRLYVSVAREPKWEPSPSGDQVLVRWMCWSV